MSAQVNADPVPFAILIIGRHARKPYSESYQTKDWTGAHYIGDTNCLRVVWSSDSLYDEIR